ncbi:tubulin-tyrosine ligase family-domain-containing protein [Spinellus fusiger]|nr:tubulin-tyrosine ligase family-domain-containing protein [Spinellus fusiger]
MSDVFYALAHLDEPYTKGAVVKALEKSTLKWSTNEDVTEENTEADLDSPQISLQWLEYEQINWMHLARNTSTSMANAYCIRKGLIRKSQLAYNITKYLSKYPQSILQQAIPETWQFELDHEDYFEEAMNEVFEVERDLIQNEQMGEDEKKHVFIIKPSMANKAAGIVVFDSMQQLRAIFTKEQDSDSEDDNGSEGDNGSDSEDEEDLMQVREWVIQRYIHNPLLIQQRKFHVRAYVLAVSNIKVYLYHDMLALFAHKEYDLNHLSDTLSHLTNTCLQTEEADFNEETSVRLFWELEKMGVEKKDLDKAFKNMQLILADVFDACVSEMTTFQALPNAFELFGIDFLIDEEMNVYFLEANAFPDFKQTGSQLQHIIQELFNATVKTAIEPFFGESSSESSERSNKLIRIYEKELLSL